MKTITVAELRQNPTRALAEVEGGETYEVTRHRHPIAKLVPYETEVPVLVPARATGGARLRDRPDRGAYTHEQVQAILADMADDR